MKKIASMVLISILCLVHQNAPCNQHMDVKNMHAVDEVDMDLSITRAPRQGTCISNQNNNIAAQLQNLGGCLCNLNAGIGSVVDILQTPSCGAHIITGVTTITAPGYYCVANSFTVGPDGFGILVHADDVIIDLHGNTIDCAFTGSAGVVVDGADRVVVGGGFIIDSLYAGVWVRAANGTLVHDLFLEGNNARCRYGIFVEGSAGVLVERCDVFGFGGLFRPDSTVCSATEACINVGCGSLCEQINFCNLNGCAFAANSTVCSVASIDPSCTDALLCCQTIGCGSLCSLISVCESLGCGNPATNTNRGRPLGAAFAIATSRQCSFTDCIARESRNHGFMAGYFDLGAGRSEGGPIDYCSFIRCKALENDGDGFYLVDMFPVAFQSGGTYNVFDSCISQGNLTHGFTGISDYLTMQHCIANDNMEGGFSVYGTGVTVQSCVANGNGADGIQYSNFLVPVKSRNFIYPSSLTAVFGIPDDLTMVIENCIASNNTANGVNVLVQVGIVLPLNGGVVRNTEASRNGANGIQITGCCNEVRGCAVLSNGAAGINSLSNAHFFNNIFNNYACNNATNYSGVNALIIESTPTVSTGYWANISSTVC